MRERRTSAGAAWGTVAVLALASVASPGDGGAASLAARGSRAGDETTPGGSSVASSSAARSTVTASPNGTPNRPRTAPRSDVETFADLLSRWRAGEDASLDELRAAADRCAITEGRPEFRAHVEYLASMPRESRVRGFELERQFYAIRSEVVDAAGSSVDEWRAERTTIFARLDELVDASIQGPDVSPAARALSLRAVLRGTRVAQDREMPASERAEWVDLGRHDAELALELFERAGMVPPRLETLQALAGLELARDDRDGAADLYAEMRDLARRVHQPKLEMAALVGLARMAQDAGDMEDAARWLADLARITNPAASWELAKRQGQYLLSIDEPRRAAEFLAQNAPNDSAQRVEWHVLMEGALIRAGDVDAARAHVAALSNGPKEMDLAALARADAMLHTGDASAARSALQVVADPLRLPPRLQADFHRLDGCLRMSQGELDEAAAAFERALSVGDTIESRMSHTSASSPTASVMGETIGLETVALLAGVRVDQGRAFDAATLIEDRQLRASRGALAHGTPPAITPAVVRAWADAYEFGLVTWVVGADTTVVVHVQRGGDALGVRIGVGRSRIAEAARRLREAVLDGQESRARALAAEIQSVLLPAKIEERFGSNAAADQGRVLVCTHGPIEDIPFALMPVFSDVSTRRLVPVHLPGLIDVARGPSPSTAQLASWSVLGNPVSGDGMASLPGAGQEIDDVASRTHAALVRSGERFDHAALQEALTSGRALHLATHLRSDAPSLGAADARFARAAFELSNGERFDVADVRRASPRLPLAFLSACETGTGQFIDAQTSVGMVRAFLESGTRNLVVTSWPVEDHAAREFALAFHAAIAQGKSPSRAVVAAREVLRAAGVGMAEWAAFELVGRD